MEQGVPARRACQAMDVATSTLYYEPAQNKNQALTKRLIEVARPGMGYRMARAILLPEFEPLNHKRVHRLWREAKLARQKKLKRIRTGKTVSLAATRANQVWCVDFCFDACLNGTKLKVLAVKDEYTRECLALEAATSITGQAVRRVLERLMEQREAPGYVRSDNGPEFVCRDLTIWLANQGSQSRFIKPGSPWQNGHAESFMSRLRAECLDAEVFCNLQDARLKLGIYRRYYNDQRPHSALGYVPPSQFAAQAAELRRAMPSYTQPPAMQLATTESNL